MKQKEEKLRILKPKIDVVFQSLFNQANEKITKSFVESLLEEKIEKMQINETKELFREKPKDKLGILDLELDINDNEKVDVEIQLVTPENFVNRLLYYFSRLYASTVKVAEDYIEAKRVVIVAIIDDEFKITEDVKEIETKWRLMCAKYPELELTNKIEIVIIELRKAKENYLKNKKDAKSQWALFLDNTESKEVREIMEENEEIKEAVIKVHEMSEDEKLQKLADLREKYIMDQKAVYKSGENNGIEIGEKRGIEIGEKRGIEIGEKRGIEIGEKRGKKQEKIEIAKKMLKKGIEIEQIMIITELDKEEIEALLQ